MIFKPAELKDLPVLIELYKSTLFHCKHRIDTYFKNFIIDNNVLLLYDNNILVGAYAKETFRIENTITNRKGQKQILWLQQIMVYPAYQKQGYGKIMLHHLMKNNINNLQIRLECYSELVLYYMQFGFQVIERNINNNNELKNIMFFQPKSLYI